jgi:hypothetical protein
VIGIAVNDEDLDLGCRRPDLVALARGADCGPQAGKSRPPSVAIAGSFWRCHAAIE